MTMHGSNFEVKYASEVIKKDIPKLPKSVKNLIKKAIETRIAIEPIAYGKPLQHSWMGHRRVRVSDYRIIYRVDNDKKLVYIVAIKHRKDVYK